MRMPVCVDTEEAIFLIEGVLIKTVTNVDGKTKRYFFEKAYLPASCTPSAGQSAPPWDLRSIKIYAD